MGNKDGQGKIKDRSLKKQDSEQPERPWGRGRNNLIDAIIAEKMRGTFFYLF
jgi:hypothetical protein